MAASFLLGLLALVVSEELEQCLTPTPQFPFLHGQVVQFQPRHLVTSDSASAREAFQFGAQALVNSGGDPPGCVHVDDPPLDLGLIYTLVDGSDEIVIRC
ncbi:MAG: hypothetical protein FWF02_07905 [Micrococcales bacterium]|nr:hypothetical protein [Micrococcales bacterium]MCL2667614.1 hypothetical protein [Micrococcales bacterium]